MIEVQLTFAEILHAQAEAAWRAGGHTDLNRLRPGDRIEIRRGDRELAGWAAMRHPVDGIWQVQLDRTPATARLPVDPYHVGPWRPYMVLLATDVWRCVGHDSTWRLGPEPAAVCAWMREQADTLPYDRWHEIFHAAMAAWPIGVDPAWRRAVEDTFTALAIERIPIAEWLRNDRKARRTGATIWEVPRAIQRRITREIWPLPGPARWPAILALRWTRAEHFNDPDVLEPEGRRAFNRHACTIYAGYLRWAVEHADSPRQLVELLDSWGSNPAPEEGVE